MKHGSNGFRIEQDLGQSTPSASKSNRPNDRQVNHKSRMLMRSLKTYFQNKNNPMSHHKIDKNLTKEDVKNRMTGSGWKCSTHNETWEKWIKDWARPGTKCPKCKQGWKCSWCQKKYFLIMFLSMSSIIQRNLLMILLPILILVVYYIIIYELIYPCHQSI